MIKLKDSKAKIELSLLSLKFAKFKEKVNEKLFSKLAKNSMSPQQQIQIKARYDNYVKLLGYKYLESE